MSPEYPCPCCGYIVFMDPPGSHAVCPICCWEDDVIQLRWADWGDGANRPSLIAAQLNFASSGAVEQRLAALCREPYAYEQRDPLWRRAMEHDPFETCASDVTWPDDFTELYYWRPCYWRAWAQPAPVSGIRVREVLSVAV